MKIRAIDLLEKKVADAKAVVHEAFDRYAEDALSVAWTGGKDSTLVLWIVREVCRERNIKIPRCFCIDEGDMFPEIQDFIRDLGRQWQIEMEMIHNSDVSTAAGGVLGAPVRVEQLNESNRREIERLGYDDSEFPFEPESFVGNHLMKTVTLNEYLFRRGIAGFFEGIRWDEQESRANEQFFSPRAATEFSPEHVRICPILHFVEREVWEAHFHFAIPICNLYELGYRSLGARITTTKSSEAPAWEQDLENTTERGGRRQDKEHLMQKLRDLGYM